MNSLTDYENDLINKFSDINEKNYQTNISSMITSPTNKTFSFDRLSM